MNILIVEGEEGPPLLDTVRCMGQEEYVNVYVACIGQRKWLAPVRYSKYTKAYFHLENDTDDSNVKNIIDLAKRLNVKTILPAKEGTFLLFSKYLDLLEDFNLPPISDFKTLTTVTDKWLLNNWLKDNGLPTPKSRQASNSNLGQIDYPFLLKPKHGIGGNDISLIQTRDSIRAKLDDDSILMDKYIFQDLIVGEDIDISLVAINGKIHSYTIQQGLIRKDFSFATGIIFFKDPKFMEHVEVIIDKLNWTGITHLDFIYNKEDDLYYLLDFNPRFWSTILGSLNAGINFPLLMVELANGQNVEKRDYKECEYYLNRSAISNFLKNLFRKGKIISLKNSSLNYAMSDPLPEFIKGLSMIVSKLRR